MGQSDSIPQELIKAGQCQVNMSSVRELTANLGTRGVLFREGIENFTNVL